MTYSYRISEFSSLTLLPVEIVWDKVQKDEGCSLSNSRGERDGNIVRINVVAVEGKEHYHC